MSDVEWQTWPADEAPEPTEGTVRLIMGKPVTVEQLRRVCCD